jgi:flagellar assembly protein FliH
MSSKLHRAENGADAPKLAFRPAGAPPVAIPRVQIREREPADGPSEAEIQAMLRDAEQRAHAAGEAAGAAAGWQRGAEQIAPAVAALNCIVEEISGLRARVRREAEASTVDLAIAIARRVLHRELATDPEAILGLVRSACDRLNMREAHRLRVAPSDLAVIQAQRSRLTLPERVEIAADPSLVSGSAIFETSRGELDASAHTQLDEIERGLTDLVRRHRP